MLRIGLKGMLTISVEIAHHIIVSLFHVILPEISFFLSSTKAKSHAQQLIAYKIRHSRVRLLYPAPSFIIWILRLEQHLADMRHLRINGYSPALVLLYILLIFQKDVRICT